MSKNSVVPMQIRLSGGPATSKQHFEIQNVTFKNKGVLAQLLESASQGKYEVKTSSTMKNADFVLHPDGVKTASKSAKEGAGAAVSISLTSFIERVMSPSIAKRFWKQFEQMTSAHTVTPVKESKSKKSAKSSKSTKPIKSTKSSKSEKKQSKKTEEYMMRIVKVLPLEQIKTALKNQMVFELYKNDKSQEVVEYRIVLSKQHMQDNYSS